ncbi:glucosidase 2 subunit beta [Anthonomus grandis grandis]|uniref:glucosidase 2 subunit beta n=1 Tax=Anthonomus grandis grandis TaxID=2921223 RepID=UPI002166195B|nr:glucosidase 2 subunit beta [Anthonomus grandis grandis]
MPGKYQKYNKVLLTRRRKNLCLASTLLMSLLFVSYQFFNYYVLSNESVSIVNSIDEPNTENKLTLIRGTHFNEKKFYTSNNGKFTCIKSGELIDFSKINDDYCDCEDSSDEPGTNACPDALFYCSQVVRGKTYKIPSTKVNDGICDCCDGSDEYISNNVIASFNRDLQEKTKHFLVPCPNVC